MIAHVLKPWLVLTFLSAVLPAAEVRLGASGNLLVDGQPYFVKGAGGEGSLQELAARGGNSIRTWTTNDLDVILDEAARFKMTVCAGIWLEPECSWFSYAKPEDCERQTKRVRETVEQYRKHPALLLWGIGNEIEGDGKNEPLWKQMNRLARLVHEIDPAHPTLTAVAGLSPDKAAGLKAHCPDLDIIGINTYGALPSLRKHLEKIGWTRPWMLTEYGPRGFWEIAKSPWDAPHEPTSSEKAAFLRMAYKATIRPEGGCLGSYAFIWGDKQEATMTWFGLLMENGDTTESVDALQEIWTGQKPSNSAPQLKSLSSAASSKVLKSGAMFSAQVSASDPDGDTLSYLWMVTKESAGRDDRGREKPTLPLPGCVVSNGKAEVEVKAPKTPGHYRLHVRIGDGKKHAATANFPFSVEP